MEAPNAKTILEEELIPHRRAMGRSDGYRERAERFRLRAEALQCLVKHYAAMAEAQDQMADWLDATVGPEPPELKKPSADTQPVYQRPARTWDKPAEGAPPEPPWPPRAA